MYKLKCLNCDHIFSQEEKLLRRNYDDFSAREWETLCPCCKSDDIVEVKKCKKCGEHMEDFTTDEVCEECASDIIKRLNDIVIVNFSPYEIEVLEELDYKQGIFN